MHEDDDVHPGHPLRGPEEAPRDAPGGVAGLSQDGAQARRRDDVRRPGPAQPARRLRGLGRRPPDQEPGRHRPRAARRPREHHHPPAQLGRHHVHRVRLRLDRDRRRARRMEALGHGPPPVLGLAPPRQQQRRQARGLPHLERPADAGAVRRGAARGGWRHAGRGAARPPPPDRGAPRGGPVRPPHPAPRAPVGGHGVRAPHHPLRGRPRPGHQARRPVAVHGRQVDRLPHGRPVRRDARAGPRQVPVAPPPRWRGMAVRDLAATATASSTTSATTGRPAT